MAIFFVFNFETANLTFFLVIGKGQFEAVYPAASEFSSNQCQFV